MIKVQGEHILCVDTPFSF